MEIVQNDSGGLFFFHDEYPQGRPESKIDYIFIFVVSEIDYRFLWAKTFSNLQLTRKASL